MQVEDGKARGTSRSPVSRQIFAQISKERGCYSAVLISRAATVSGKQTLIDC